MLPIVCHYNDLILSVLSNVFSLKAKMWLKSLHFYMKGLYACVFDDANKCMFNAQMCKNITWPLRQVPTAVMWCLCNMTQPLFKLVECWQIRSTSPCLRLWSLDRKERLPYPYQKRVADSSSSILGCCSWLVHGVDCQMNCYRQMWQCWSSLVWQPGSRVFYLSFNCG